MATNMNTTTVRFALKDAGRESLATAIGGILRQDAIYDGTQTVSHAVGGFIVNCSSRQRNTKGGIAVNIRFSMNSGGRKAFANAVGEILGLDVVYNGTPSFAYTVGGYTIDRSGALTFPNNIFHRESADLIMALRERGYEVETDELPDFHALQMTEREELGLGRERRDYSGEDGPQSSDVPEDDDNDKLTIEISLEGFTDKAIENLGNIVARKSRLFRKALATNSLRMDITDDDKLRFPWFTLTGADGEADAYSRFISALCEMAKNTATTVMLNLLM
jgi:hypothetical protein